MISQKHIPQKCKYAQTEMSYSCVGIFLVALNKLAASFVLPM